VYQDYHDALTRIFHTLSLNFASSGRQVTFDVNSCVTINMKCIKISVGSE